MRRNKIKAANKEVNEVMKSMKSAMEYTRGSNGSANTIQAAFTRGPYERFTTEEKA